IIEHHTVKNDLMEKVNKIKKQYDHYAIDEYAKEHNKIVLRLPPYHCELNPFEMAWASVEDKFWDLEWEAVARNCPENNWPER
ncbi:DDE 3 domain-containing protein, partial [Aphis craccivora]